MHQLKLNEDEQELLEGFLEHLKRDEMEQVAKSRGFDAELCQRFWDYIGREDEPPGRIIIEANLDELKAAFGNERSSGDFDQRESMRKCVASDFTALCGN